MSHKIRFANFHEWYVESGAQETAAAIQESLGCTRAAALQILLLMDMNELFAGENCPECNRPFKDEDDDSAYGL